MQIFLFCHNDAYFNAKHEKMPILFILASIFVLTLYANEFEANYFLESGSRFRISKWPKNGQSNTPQEGFRSFRQVHDVLGRFLMFHGVS